MRPVRGVAGFHEAQNLTEAIGLLGEYGDRVRIIAGGTDLLSLPLEGLGNCGGVHLIDISGLGLDYMENTADGIRIGAAVRINAIARSEYFSGSLVVLGEAAKLHSTHTIRNRATIGGNLCNASPGADMPPPLLALDASLVLTGPEGDRILKAEAFFMGPNCTALAPGEILREIIIPPAESGTGSSFFKLRRHQTEVDMALVNVATRLSVEKGSCTKARIGLGCVGPVPFRARKAEVLLLGNKPDKELIRRAAETAANESAPLSDNRASAAYRKEMVAVLVADALERSLQRSRG